MKNKFKVGDVVMVAKLPKDVDEKRWFQGNVELEGADMGIGSIHLITKVNIDGFVRIETDYLWLNKKFFEKIGKL